MLTTIYLSGDEVNRAYGRDLGAQHGVDVMSVHPDDRLDVATRQSSRHVRTAVICDYDSIPPGQRWAIMRRLWDLKSRATVVVHSYGMEEWLGARLRRAGITVRRALDDGLFQELTAGSADHHVGQGNGLFRSVVRGRLTEYAAHAG